ncbi:MAG: flagellar hook-associated protein FlgK [Rhodobacterales bacterium]|nr:MAG: flagellar hook-associated protein FlgK [Rhodobacterales bacterium]
MSLTGAFSNALSGLNAASRAAQLTASNLSNVMTDGYARRELDVGARALGGVGGVSVNGIVRHVDLGLISDRRAATSDFANTNRLAEYYSKLENLVGTPSDGDSLSARIADFESALISAASRPDIENRLDTVLQSARSVADTFASVSRGIQNMRSDADTEIGTTVERLNDALAETRELNLKIATATIKGRDTSAFEDQRQLLIDEISEIVPVKQVPRDLGAVALFTPGGAVILDGTAAEFEFSPVNLVTEHMTIGAGHLSGLSINGIDLSLDNEQGHIHGGRLAALFEIRDELAPAAQAQLDANARDLVERFQDSGLDPTLFPGDAGLFTDGGAAFAAADEVGLSARLSINAAVDPSAGGATWRLRDGLGAAAPGDVGQASFLQDLGAALTTLRSPASGAFSGSAYSVADLQANMLSRIGTDRHLSDQNLTFATTQLNELEALVLEDGVDSDQEMQKLMLIEQAYAANAQVMTTIDEMMQTLMRI